MVVGNDTFILRTKQQQFSLQPRVEINESNVALAAFTEQEGVTDSVVIQYDELKRKRHEHFISRKRPKRVRSTRKLSQQEITKFCDRCDSQAITTSSGLGEPTRELLHRA
ncbi:MAG: hypothetical protein J07HQX50_00982 [Haloquadratum sp. J07HQX50]|jgi:hypothetical protein|nr:MAG: hypothetical protein J07HQX50_00982 [Haloquadratum sp. J07HQX50]